MTAADTNVLPLPDVTLDGRPFWDATAEGRLTFQRCQASGRPVFPPRYLSPFGGGALIWEESAGLGTLYSFSTIHRPPGPAWADRVPYTVGFVELDEGFFMFTGIQVQPNDLAIGMRLKVRFEQRGDFSLPIFAAAD